MKNIIYKQRKLLGINIKQIAEYVGVSEATVSRWESGNIANMKRNYIYSLSEILKISPLVLLNEENEGNQITKGVFIPVLGNVQAGIPIQATQEILDYEEISEQMARQGEHFGLRIKGDSMQPRIMEGDVVIVRQQTDVDSGKLAVVLVNGTDATVKRINKDENGILLIPNNPAYMPQYYTKEQIEQLPVQIIGEVVELRGKTL